MNPKQLIRGRTLLVTGGTGSFGQSFIRENLQKHYPRKVIVFSRDELKQYDMRRVLPDQRLRFFIGDVRDDFRLLRAFDQRAFCVDDLRSLETLVRPEVRPSVYAADWDPHVKKSGAPEEPFSTIVSDRVNLQRFSMDLLRGRLGFIEFAKGCPL